MEYPLENARYQWEEGQHRLRRAAPDQRRQLDRAVQLVVEELRRRMGAAFRVAELARLYATDPHWAEDLAIGAGAGTNSAWVVDAAFGRYAREAADFAGGRAHDRPMRD